MAYNNSVVQSVEFYEFGKNSLWLSIVHNKQWNRFLLDITRNLPTPKTVKPKKAPAAPI